MEKYRRPWEIPGEILGHSKVFSDSQLFELERLSGLARWVIEQQLDRDGLDHPNREEMLVLFRVFKDAAATAIDLAKRRRLAGFEPKPTERGRNLAPSRGQDGRGEQ